MSNKAAGKQDAKPALTPKLRFPEFRDAPEWREVRLGDVADIKTGPFGSTLHQSDYVTSGTPIVTVEHLSDHGLIHKNLPLVSDNDKQRLASYVLKGGDIVFSRVGSVDRNSLVSKKEDGWLFSGRLLRIRTQASVVIPEFLSFYFQIEATKQKIRSVAVGQTMASLNTEILNEIRVVTAAPAEQQKIAECLTTLDEVIAAQCQKLDALKTHKKVLMQQLFPREGETLPRLRFPEFQSAPEWEEKEVGEVFKVTRGNVLAMTLVADSESEEMPYPVFSSQTKRNGLCGFYSDYLYENAITWTTDGANAGDVNYRAGKFYCTNVCGVLLNTDGYANPCVAALINSVSRKHVSYVGNPKLMNGVMSGIKIPFPTVPEQERISTCLTSLDDLITAQSAKLEGLKTHKKGLMQQLFPSPEEVGS